MNLKHRLIELFATTGCCIAVLMVLATSIKDGDEIWKGSLAGIGSFFVSRMLNRRS